MTLRARLTLVLGVLVLVPLLAGALLVGTVVPRAVSDRTDDALRGTSAAAVASIADSCRELGAAVRSLARDLPALGAQRAASATVNDGLAEWAAVVTPAGRVLGSSGPTPASDLASLGRCSAGDVTAAWLSDSSRTVMANGTAVVVVTGRTMDTPALQKWADVLAFDGTVLLKDEGQVVAASNDRELAGQTTLSAPPAPGQPFTVVVAVDAPGDALLLQTVVLVVLGAFILALVLARWLANDLVGPVEKATEVAEQVAAGDLTRTLDVGRDDEVGRLARAFNHMTAELRGYVHALESSRDAMRANLERLGEALSATHDLDTLLPVVLESALSSVGAGAGLVLVVDDDRRFTVRAEQWMDQAGLPVPAVVLPGVGVLGRVAATGVTARGLLGAEDLQAVSGEPARGQVLAVPLLRGLDVIGVIALYEPQGAEWFTDADEEALHSLASQAAIAVENVVLHNEAQLASLTDPLTGLWNVRYLTLNINQEIERAARFDRPLGLLMLDLDRFKEVNDTYGHARGDQVLVEFGRRLHAQVREVDTVARYGGEEFVVVLPETSVEGAARLAERIGAVVRQAPFESPDGPPLPVTVSIGVSAFPDHGTTAPTLLRAADAALYQAKNGGRDRWVAAVPVAQRPDR